MRILILSDTESSHGGAISTTRLAHGLLAVGAEVHRTYAYAQNKRTPWVSHPLLSHLSASGEAITSLIKLLPERPQNQLLQNLSIRKLKKLIAKTQPDVVNIHTTFTTGWDMGILEAIPAHLPQAWTLHDMWSFTGACTYAFYCNKFTAGCDAACATEKLCPGVHKHVPPAEIGPIFQRKLQFLKDRPHLTCITPSVWMQKEALRGAWRDHQVIHIPYGLNLNTFRPVDRASARESLGIKAQGPVLLLPATNLGEERKGARFALGALKQMSDKKITLLTMGHEPPKLDLPGVTIQHMGFISSEVLQSILYSAADLMLHPATEDNLPNTVLEAMACGTPVVGFHIGGMPDMVTDGVTGWLNPNVSVEGFTECLQRALTALSSGTDLRAACRSKTEKEYPLALQGERYVTLFKQLMQKQGSTR
ncbi:MAG TPA: glycosyltransferase [Verrucomicrobiae bacterium]